MLDRWHKSFLLKIEVIGHKTAMITARIQRATYAIRDCMVCHTKKQEGDNPHVPYYPIPKKP